MEALKPNDLHHSCDCKKRKFSNTKEIPVLSRIVGQDRALKAIDTGLRTRVGGFNLFITGPTGTGRNSTIRSILEEISPSLPTPPDWCYVFNFEDLNKPNAISLKPGHGITFKRDMAEFISIIRDRIPKQFESDHYDNEKNKLIERFETQGKAISEAVSQRAKELDIQVTTSPEGIFTIPIIDGKPATPETFQTLTDEQKKTYEKNRQILQVDINNALKKGQQIDREMRENLKDLDKRIGLFAIEPFLDDLKQKYADNDEIVLYLDELKKDIALNIGLFKDENKPKQSNPFMPISETKGLDSLLERYKVNLLVDNSKQKGAPIIFEMNPSFYNLFGSIEYRQEMGYWMTDLNYIQAGSLLQANGGYLVLQANDILSIPYVWDRLKRTIKSQQMVIENLDEQIKVIPTSTLKPQPIEIDLKVILIGSSEIYSLLYAYDEDFRKYFKVRSHFDDEMDRNEETESLYASFIATQCQRNDPSVNFDGEAISRVIEYGSRIIEDQQKLTTQFNLIADIVNESIYWAAQNHRKTVTLSDVVKTLQEKRYRANLVEEKMQDMILDGSIRIDTEGKVVGQINGLSVLSNGEYTFGRPTRITATSSLGKGNLINIEKESGLSGPIFDKGVMILSAYINNVYANERPFPVSVNLCFEQSYSGVEGDSASAAELVVMLSSIADVPIRQDLAITGSMDQQGNIQPIGGVNYKIEGFFDICVKKGLTGTQGVIIPWQNKQNLMLRDDIVEAVSDGKFHIYIIKRAEEAIELLTGMPAPQFDKKVEETLEKFIRITKEFQNK